MGVVKTARGIKEKKGKKKIAEVNEVADEVIHIQSKSNNINGINKSLTSYT